MAADTQITTKSMGNGIIITLLTPELLEDIEIASLEQKLLQTITQSNVVNFVINFENVNFLSSAVLRVLIKVNSVIAERQGKLRLCEIPPKIMEVFKITRLHKVFDIRQDVEAALDSLK